MEWLDDWSIWQLSIHRNQTYFNKRSHTILWSKNFRCLHHRHHQSYLVHYICKTLSTQTRNTMLHTASLDIKKHHCIHLFGWSFDNHSEISQSVERNHHKDKPFFDDLRISSIQLDHNLILHHLLQVLPNIRIISASNTDCVYIEIQNDFLNFLHIGSGYSG